MADRKQPVALHAGHAVLALHVDSLLTETEPDAEPVGAVLGVGRLEAEWLLEDLEAAGALTSAVAGVHSEGWAG